MDEWFDFVCGDFEDTTISDLVVQLAEDEEEETPKRQGSIPGRQNLARNFELGHQMLIAHYFSPNSVYPEHLFERRFRMPKRMFLDIAEKVTERNDYFRLKFNAAGKPGLSNFQKCAAAIRQLAYGTASDATDDYLQIGESTSNEALKEFCKTLVEVYSEHYMRTPNRRDKLRMAKENEARGFPGMLGSIDCMHWRWKNCPVALHGQYQGKEGKPTVVLEAIASYNCHIWHCYFGTPGSCNDVNVLDHSPLMDKIVNENILDTTYTINGTTRERGYLLADGIYPDWSCFVKTIQRSPITKEKNFAAAQESVRKDVERAFGLLQGEWSITNQPCRLWDISTVTSVMYACIILHNMRIEYDEDMVMDPSINTQQNERVSRSFAEYSAIRTEIKDARENAKLTADLIEHLWNTRGKQRDEQAGEQ